MFYRLVFGLYSPFLVRFLRSRPFYDLFFGFILAPRLTGCKMPSLARPVPAMILVYI